MVSAFMPDVVVEIAFNAGFTTPSSSRTWTDVSTYVELSDRINIAFGRQDERSTADANQLTLTLDNTDGRFTASRSASPYYPNVKIGRPIRVKVTPPGGSTVTRFVGFIDEWPVEWDGSDAYAKATITASSRMSRLGLRAKLRSAIEEEILTTSPHVYYTLGDASESVQASDSSGSTRSPLVAAGSGSAVVFGNATGPATDGLTAAEFAAGQYLRVDLSGRDPSALRVTVRVTALPAATIPIIQVVTNLGPIAIFLTSAGLVTAGQSGLTITGPNINDGATHDVVFVFLTTSAVLYVDGVNVGTNGGIPLASNPGGRLEVGSGFTGTLSHVGYYDEDSPPLLTADAEDMAAGVATGFAGEATDVRLLRVLAWTGVPAAEVDVEAGTETMTYQLTSGMSAVDVLRECESTEGGVLFDGADGDVKFHNRSHRYLAAAAATLNMASQHVGADYAPRLDRSTLINDITVNNPTTEENARAFDSTSSDEYGIATSSATSVADSYSPLQEKATWMIASYAEPQMRCPSLTVDVLAHQGITPSAATLLGITAGSLLAVTNAPSQSDSTSPSYFVEGYTESIGPESYSITFNLSPTYPMLDTFVLDSATRGLLDTSLLAY